MTTRSRRFVVSPAMQHGYRILGGQPPVDRSRIRHLLTELRIARLPKLQPGEEVHWL